LKKTIARIWAASCIASLAAWAGAASNVPATPSEAAPAQVAPAKSAQGGGPAVDKKAVEEHVRAAYDFPAAVKLELGDPGDCEIEGFRQLSLKISYGEMQQVENLYLSKDRRFYLLGGFKDLRVHPYAERMSKMDLKDAALRGKAKASVVVAEFTDFECPYCRKGYQIMRNGIMKDFPDDVRWVYKSLPLKNIHPWAEPAAMAVECAKRQGHDKFWSLHDGLFEAQETITPANFEEKLQDLAKQSKLDMGKFKACYDKKETLPEVQRDVKEATELGIQSTPSFLVNGKMVPGADYDSLKSAVQGFLKKGK
jgi:protein-disulfide isomerase